MMRHAVLITFLLSAQLISWNASPLFLCLDGDGELGIDLGPESCNCCRHQHDSANYRGHDRTCDEHGVALTHCDCTHVQITVAWTAVTVPPEGNRPVVASGAAAVVADIDGPSRLLLPEAAASLTTPRCPLSVQSTMRSAILRC
jgi:hypothetical protein